MNKLKILLIPGCLVTIGCLAILFYYLSSHKIGCHYNKDYWTWQKNLGEAGGRLDLFKFEAHIKPTDTVIEFGCGGGFLLSQLNCNNKIGIDINNSALEQAKTLGLKTYNCVIDVPDEVADVIISNHALEHVNNPFETLSSLRNKLRSGGLIIIVVPSEQASEPHYVYNENDVNQHLYTWTPLTLGNLVKAAGFKIISADAIRHCWTDNYSEESKKTDLAPYHKLCRQKAIETNNYQVKVVAKK